MTRSKRGVGCSASAGHQRSLGPHRDLNVTMRSWLVGAEEQQRPMAKPQTQTQRKDAIPATLEQLQALSIDASTDPSPLFAPGAPGSSPARQPPAPLAPTDASTATPGFVSDGAATVLGFGAAAAQCVVWDRSGGRLIYAADNIIVLEDLQTHNQQLLQHHSRQIGALALSADGKMLASGVTAEVAGEQHMPGTEGSDDAAAAEVCVWDLSSRSLLHVLRQHGGGVRLLSFSPDGGWLVSVGAGAGGGLVLWGLEEGEPVALGRTDGVSGLLVGGWLLGGFDDAQQCCR